MNYETGYKTDTSKIENRLHLFFLLLLLTLAGCQSTNDQIPAAPYTYVESTQLFDNRTASVSMRATFTNSSPSIMERGYLFQFRRINQQAAFLSSISIIAGGQRYFLEEGQVVLPAQQGLTLKLSLDESLEIAKYPSSLLQFKYNNQSYLFSIELHQLKEFAP